MPCTNLMWADLDGSGEKGAGVKTKCCKSYQRKGKACKKCPVMAHRDPKAQKPGRKHNK